MSLYYGFYNAVEGDRTYDALDMGRMFDGVISDGVFNGYGDVFAVTPNSGLTVNVGSGRAWFNHTWTYNDAALPFTLNSNTGRLTRLDTICFKIDTTDAVRANSIMVSEGNIYGTPVVPVNTLGVYYYPIAVVSVAMDAAEIKASDIHMVLGSGTYQGVTYTPYVQIADVNVNATLDDLKADINTWFESMKEDLTLDTDVATALWAKVDSLQSGYYAWLTDNAKVMGYIVKDNLTINHGVASTVTWTDSVVPAESDGYKRVSNVPFQISVENASSSGSGSSVCNVSSVASGSCTVRNMHSSSTAKVRVRCYFLYQKIPGYGSIEG